MHQSEIDNLKRMFRERLSEFVASLLVYCVGWMDEPIRDELDVVDLSELQSCDENGRLLKKKNWKVSIFCRNTYAVLFGDFTHKHTHCSR